jgi:hypothetical protein
MIYRDPLLIESIKSKLATVLIATKETLPAAPEDLNPVKGYYPWNCLYCAYWGTCRIGAEKVLVGKSYKLKAA